MSLLSQQSQVNADTAFFAPASGGGGGGGGPDPAFSSITIQTGVMTTNSNQGFVFQNTTTPVLQDAYLQGQSNLPMAAGPGVANVFLLNSAAGTANSLTLGAGNDNAGYIWSGAAGTQDGSQALYIKAAGVYMSSLTVSSINGAAPGGGGSVPANLAVSTLTVNDQPTALDATLEMKATDVNLYAIQCVSSATLRAEIQLGFIGGRDQFYTDVGQINTLYTSSIIGNSGQISLNPAGADSIRLGGLGAPGDITLAPAGGGVINMSATTNMPLTANISSLTVSSINGAAPGGGGNGGAIGVQSIPDTGPLVLICDAPGGNGNPTPLTTPLGISTQLGHTYTYTAEASIQGGPNQTGEAQVQFQLGNNSRFYDRTIPVSTIVGPNQLVSLNWRFIGTGGGNAIYGYAWDPLSNAASTTVNLSKQSLTDYGVIL